MDVLLPMKNVLGHAHIQNVWWMTTIRGGMDVLGLALDSTPASHCHSITRKRRTDSMIYLCVYLAGVFITFCFNVAYSIQIEEITLKENAIGSIGWPALWLVYFFARLMHEHKQQ